MPVRASRRSRRRRPRERSLPPTQHTLLFGAWSQDRPISAGSQAVSGRPPMRAADSFRSLRGWRACFVRGWGVGTSLGGWGSGIRRILRSPTRCGLGCCREWDHKRWGQVLILDSRVCRTLPRAFRRTAGLCTASTVHVHSSAGRGQRARPRTFARRHNCRASLD